MKRLGGTDVISRLVWTACKNEFDRQVVTPTSHITEFFVSINHCLKYAQIHHGTHISRVQFKPIQHHISIAVQQQAGMRLRMCWPTQLCPQSDTNDNRCPVSMNLQT